MMKTPLLLLIALSSLLSVNGIAQTTPERPAHLNFDASSPLDFVINFEEEDRSYPPVRSDFILSDYRFLSSDAGERWAIVNVYNPNKGGRTIKADQLQAVLFDGSIKEPLNLDRYIKGESTLTLFINFGKQRFPLYNLRVRNE